MPKRIDHEKNIGKRFGMLTVLSCEMGRRMNYVCKCDCGKIVRKIASNVESGATTSCGCMQFITDRRKEHAKEMGLRTRIHEEVCDNCGKKEHYAKGLCRNCYERRRRNGTTEYKNRK